MSNLNNTEVAVAVNAIQKGVGSWVRITTTFSETFEGNLHLFDPRTESLLLFRKSPDLDSLTSSSSFQYSPTINAVGLPLNISLAGSVASGVRNDFFILSLSIITSFTILSQQTPGVGDGARLNVKNVSLSKLEARQQTGLYTTHKLLEKLGRNVTQEAQLLFNALSRTLPCRWEGTSIVVFFNNNDEIKIVSPYTTENCTGAPTPTLQRVKKVLEGERAKLPKKMS